jgi:hypothetical protein
MLHLKMGYSAHSSPPTSVTYPAKTENVGRHKRFPRRQKASPSSRGDEIGPDPCRAALGCLLLAVPAAVLPSAYLGLFASRAKSSASKCGETRSEASCRASERDPLRRWSPNRCVAWMPTCEISSACLLGVVTGPEPRIRWKDPKSKTPNLCRRMSPAFHGVLIRRRHRAESETPATSATKRIERRLAVCVSVFTRFRGRLSITPAINHFHKAPPQHRAGVVKEGEVW